jgi:hypothetical protein
MTRRYIFQDQAARVTRFLEDISGRPDAMLRETACEREHYLRVRWLISLVDLAAVFVELAHLGSPEQSKRRGQARAR